jgi:hypothetical protein
LVDLEYELVGGRTSATLVAKCHDDRGQPVDEIRVEVRKIV